MTANAPLRLTLDGTALAANWQSLAKASGSASCGAAVKANGYGLGVRQVVRRLTSAGCRDFFVATWAEAMEIADLAPAIAVLHGVRPAEMALAGTAPAHIRPVLNSAPQIERWRTTGRDCDVMIDTGMNRLGVGHQAADPSLFAGLSIDTLMSHLACAEQDHPLNHRQRDRFAAIAAAVPARRYSLANSAGILLGPDYHFDLTRPGLALYGGIPCAAAVGLIHPVVSIEAEILQRRRIGTGESIGYNATFVADRDMELAVLNLGYADGYLRGFSNRGHARIGDTPLPVRGRVSMDLLIVDCSAAPALAEGDQVTIAFDLPDAAAASGLSQYELLTGLGARFGRNWM